VQPYTGLSIFVLSIRQVLGGPLFIFMSIFLLFISSFIFAMVLIFPDHPEAAGHLPQAPDLVHRLDAAYAMLMAGMLGEPISFNLAFDYFEPLGKWQKVNLTAFFILYVLYVFLALILLLNLLIALLGSSFSKTQEEATLQGRLAHANMVLRVELVADFLSINTCAGEPCGENFVYMFRDTENDKDGELPRHHESEDIFDKVPPPGQSTAEPDDLSGNTSAALKELKDHLAEV